MSILIPGMEMPDCCMSCRFHEDIYCALTDICTNTAQRCPLVPVPDHGRLIDADAFERRCMFDPEIEDMQDVIYALRDYPTIIPADPAKEGEG